MSQHPPKRMAEADFQPLDQEEEFGQDPVLSGISTEINRKFKAWLKRRGYAVWTKGKRGITYGKGVKKKT
jgi:hypothetical protein